MADATFRLKPIAHALSNLTHTAHTLRRMCSFLDQGEPLLGGAALNRFVKKATPSPRPDPSCCLASLLIFLAV